MAADKIVGLLPAFILSLRMLLNVAPRQLGKAGATGRFLLARGFFAANDLGHRLYSELTGLAQTVPINGRRRNRKWGQQAATYRNALGGALAVVAVCAN